MAKSKVIQVAVGGDRVVLLTDDGEVLTATFNGQTQLSSFIKITPQKDNKDVKPAKTDD